MESTEASLLPKPLDGVRVIELAGLGPVPYAGQLLADMGAEVISIARPGQAARLVEDRGKRSVILDLKNPSARDAALALIKTADIVTEGYRPGVVERLGLGPEICQSENPRLVYARMTGWGQQGPLSSLAGHDINYIGLTGVLHAMGRGDDVPIPPLNLVGDYGAGSLFLVSGVLAALHQAGKHGRGRVLDVAIVDGAVSLFGLMLSMHASGHWSTQRESNWLDGSRPYYRCYRCSDDRFVAVGALEPQFFDNLLKGLDVETASYGDQLNRAQHDAQHKLLETVFLQRTRDEWAQHFEGIDACVTPVLDFIEAAAHPHMQARQAIVNSEGALQPNLAPRFNPIVNTGDNSLDTFQPASTSRRGADSRSVLQELGLTAQQLEELLQAGNQS